MERGDGQHRDGLRDCQSWGHRAVIAVMGRAVTMQVPAPRRVNVCSCLLRWALGQNKVEKERAPAEAFSTQLRRGMTSHMEEGNMAQKGR